MENKIDFKKVILIALIFAFSILILSALFNKKEKKVVAPKKVRTIKTTKIITKHVEVPKDEPAPDDIEEISEDDDESDEPITASVELDESGNPITQQ